MAAGVLLCMNARKGIVLILFLLLFAAACFNWKDRQITAMDSSNESPVFVLDPGHGGEDGGAVGLSGQRESLINLAVTRRTDMLLGLFGWPCVLTRTDEDLEYPPTAVTVKQRKQADLERRAKLVNSIPRAILISIHQNQYPSADPRGAQVLYRNEPDSMRLAELEKERLSAALGKNMRASVPISDSIYLMRKVHCPAVLIECGFLSNPEELQLLCSEAYQTRLALCIACACAEYAKEWESIYGQGSKG